MQYVRIAPNHTKSTLFTRFCSRAWCTSHNGSDPPGCMVPFPYIFVVMADSLILLPGTNPLLDTWYHHFYQVASVLSGATAPAPSPATPSPGGFNSSEFAPIQYSPQMTLPNTQSLHSSPSIFRPSSPTMAFSSPVPFLSSHPALSLPLAGSSLRQPHPPGVSPYSLKTESSDVPLSENKPVSEPLNLSNAATTKVKA